MDYEIFKGVVEDKFLSYMPEKYQDMEARVAPVEKVNRRLDGLSIQKAGGGEGGMLSPTIYVNDMYEDYIRSGNLEAVLQEAAGTMERAFMRCPLALDAGPTKDKIIFQLVNTRQNEEMLRGMPHREFQDLSIIYRSVVGMDSRGILSVMLSHDLAGQLGMGESQLFEAALENTRRLLPPVVKSMSETMGEMLMGDGLPPEMQGLLPGSLPPEQDMWVITNEQETNGAGSLLYEDKLHELAERLGSDLYILPSSIHEVLAVSVGMGEPEELARIVSEINMDQVELGERLSNQVYHYDKDLRKITLATDTPNKRLDGAVAAPEPAYEAKQFR